MSTLPCILIDNDNDDDVVVVDNDDVVVVDDDDDDDDTCGTFSEYAFGVNVHITEILSMTA